MQRITPIVSVIIPTYNRSINLKKAIESVLSQTFQDFEIIVVDNHSVDGTEEMLIALNEHRIRLIKVHNYGIIAHSRNIGIEESIGKYIAFLDSDDWWTKDKLRISVESLNRGNDLVYHNLKLVLKSGYSNLKVGARKLKSPFYKDLLVNGNGIPNSSVVFRSEIKNKVGKILEISELKGVEDFDFWLRISLFTEKFEMIEKCLGYYFKGDENFSGNKENLLISIDKLIQLHYKHFKFLYPDVEPNYLLFKRARASYLCSDENSLGYLLSLLEYKINFVSRIKIYYMIIIINLKNFIFRYARVK
jgi:glycosyltransferase involved in cell wall biosynthesis